MSVLTRERWNSLIAAINELCEPSGDCPAIEPLPEVGPNHIWRKSDIRAAQDKLLEICDENEFSDIPALWKQATIDELEAAISNGRCNCECRAVGEYLWWSNSDDGFLTFTGPFRDLIASEFGESCTGNFTWELRRQDDLLVVTIHGAIVAGEIVNGDELVSFSYLGSMDHFATETFEPI